MGLLRPQRLYSSVTAIDVAELTNLGIHALLLDVDNTLTPHGISALPADVAAWLDAVRSAGIRTVAVSNGKAGRIRPFMASLGLECLPMACKPLPIGFWRAQRRLRLKRRACIAIGDQTFTDVLGAKLGGFRVWQTLPRVPEENMPFMALKRRWEARILRHVPVWDEGKR